MLRSRSAEAGRALRALLIVAMLAFATFDAGFAPAIADPIAATPEAAQPTPNISRPARAANGSSIAPPIVARTPATVAQPPAPKRADLQPTGRAYLFRGFLGEIFSRGMDRLERRIADAGITASVHGFTSCSSVAETAIADYRRDPAPITLIGHSAGGYCALDFAAKLQAEGIPVSLIVTVDPAHTCPKLPMNVERYINIFLSNGLLGGGDVKPEEGYAGHYASFDLSQHSEVVHINIDKLDLIHEQLVTKIAQLATTPAKAQGEAVPVRYVVPADADLELWDSGMAVYARQGDTLQTLAASYHVPLWSLTQMNRMSDSAALALGERVIIPRHLIPLTAVSGQSPPKLKR
jgi:hypothetical protein